MPVPKKQNGKNKPIIPRTYTVPFSIEVLENIRNIATYQTRNNSKKEILAKAFKLNAEGKLSAAANYYQLFIDKGFTDPRVFVNYGGIFQQKGHTEHAIEMYQKSISTFPNYPEAYIKMSQIYIKTGKIKEAEMLCRKSIDLSPKSYKSYFILSSSLIKQKKLGEAEKNLRKAIKLNPKFADAICNLGNVLKIKGELEEAAKCYLKAIKLNNKLVLAHCNLGNTYRDLGKFMEAVLVYKNAIRINPSSVDSYFNLGNIYRIIGNIPGAEESLIKCIKINPYFAKAYYILSLLKTSRREKEWYPKLFSKSLLEGQSKEEEVDIFFARSNILHQEENYIASAECLQIANQNKLRLRPSIIDCSINRGKELLFELEKKGIKDKISSSYPQTIFIVGMPRSGSTLVESIIGMNASIYNLGEVDIFRKSYIDWVKSSKSNSCIDLENIYYKKIIGITNKCTIVTNKWLYNYQYAGIIASQIPMAKIIHCYRNPLDNILSIYRANFAKGNEYSSSLIDCAKVYLDQEELMTVHKNKYRSKIYDLDYDLLVTDPISEIKSLISWLGWDWNDSFLSPHKTTRSISTASSVEARSPINSKSVGGWRNYIELLKPASEIITKVKKYEDIIA